MRDGLFLFSSSSGQTVYESHRERMGGGGNYYCSPEIVDMYSYYIGKTH